MTVNNLISDLLSAPLSPDWTIEGLAEQVLGAIADQRSEDAQEFVLDADTTTNRQSRRLVRPLLACLATKSAAEAGTPADLYRGLLAFKRPGSDGTVWIIGQFENRPGAVRIALRRAASPSRNSEPNTAPLGAEQSASHRVDSKPCVGPRGFDTPEIA